MKKFKTEQETFWADEFGEDYITRNNGNGVLPTKNSLFLFSTILKNIQKIHSAIEFGANIGNNLLAIKQLFPGISISAIEINKKTAKQLKKINDIEVFPISILDFVPSKSWDLVLIKGVLIHIDPEMLPKVYDLLYQSSKQYICIAEYYNQSPVEISYRGHSNKLFKRDFAGEFMDRFNDVKLVDYGFQYHRDVNFPQDDITWFLLEK